VILVPVGSSGDVLPMVALGRQLRLRGHDVRVLASPYFRAAIEAAGLVLEPFGTQEQYLRAAGDPRLWHRRQGFRVIAGELVGPAIGRMYEQIADLYAPGRTIAAGSILALGARLAQERLGLPYATVHLQPSVLRSLIDPPALGVPMPRAHVGRRLFFWLADALLVDRHLRPPINEQRQRLGLAPIRHVEPWWHSPQRVIGLFPDWFAPPPADWPGQIVLTGFPLADDGEAQPLSEALDRWLDEGDPPIVFTFGSAMMHAGRLFAAAAGACDRLGCRGLLLTPFPAQIPSRLPPGVVHHPAAPFGDLFGRTAAVVHHGGIGTTAHALAAGRPQLVIPFAHDQPDNAGRVSRLRAGRTMRAGAVTPTRLARELDRLLVDTPIKAAARQYAKRLRSPERDIGTACDLIEALAD
jgi:UDP:flavonoid glycosyltransferase YjiC (YdhE family)